VLEPEASALAPARAAGRQELGWLLAYTGLGLLLAWTLGSELSAPILALVRGARAIGRGEVGHRVSLRRTDELGELGTAFDEMSDQLAQAMTVGEFPGPREGDNEPPVTRLNRLQILA
jgi:methyl-accepting chemotaxis protein